MKQLILTIAIISAIAVGCKSNGQDDGFRSHSTDSVALKHGQQQASKLIEAKPDTPAMIKVLLDTRAYETKLRQQGMDYSADDMVKGFEEYLRTNDPALASEIVD